MTLDQRITKFILSELPYAKPINYDIQIKVRKFLKSEIKSNG